METGGRWPVAASPEFFFGFFSHFYFAECKSLPSAFPTLGKGFAECPTKSTRQIAVCRQKDAVYCMPSVTLGKAVAECFWAIAECPWHSAKRLYPVVLVPFLFRVLEFQRIPLLVLEFYSRILHASFPDPQFFFLLIWPWVHV